MEEYFRISVERKLFISVPDQQDHDLTPATRLLERRREMLEVETGLSRQKEEFAMKIDSLNQRREELQRKEQQLKDSLFKFEKFLKENDAKGLRALKKSLDERKLRELKEQEIQQLKLQSDRLLDQKNKQLTSLERHLWFQRYLESVLEHSQDFDEIKDIISRYDTLAASNQELLERSRHAQEKTHLLRLQFQNQTQELNNLMLNYNNEIARLQAKLEESVLKTQRHQQELDQFLMHQSQKSLELGQVKMAISNLFMVVRNHLNGRLQGGDIRNMLDKIGQFLVDMTAITQESAQE